MKTIETQKDLMAIAILVLGVNEMHQACNALKKIAKAIDDTAGASRFEAIDNMLADLNDKYDTDEYKAKAKVELEKLMVADPEIGKMVNDLKALLTGETKRDGSTRDGSSSIKSFMEKMAMRDVEKVATKSSMN